jgi:tRNA threonylcarbamoyladenosine biosynthesis protein TsaB
VLLLALDTCDARGSIALLSDQCVLGELPHLGKEEYSTWLLPAVDRLLAEHRVSHCDLERYAVASGPGSFTGVRVGLTTAKAWSEVYGKPIFPVSRLEVLATSVPAEFEYAAAFIDAHRSQLFAALYHRMSDGWQTILEESVIDPAAFFESSTAAVGKSHLAWVSLDPQILSGSPFWDKQDDRKAPLISVNPPLAAALGKYALQSATLKAVDALCLDANYVRRSDAEIFGKKAAGK